MGMALALGCIKLKLSLPKRSPRTLGLGVLLPYDLIYNNDIVSLDFGDQKLNIVSLDLLEDWPLA